MATREKEQWPGAWTRSLPSNAEFQTCKPPVWPQFSISNRHMVIILYWLPNTYYICISHHVYSIAKQFTCDFLLAVMYDQCSLTHCHMLLYSFCRCVVPPLPLTLPPPKYSRWCLPPVQSGWWMYHCYCHFAKRATTEVRHSGWSHLCTTLIQWSFPRAWNTITCH